MSPGRTRLCMEPRVGVEPTTCRLRIGCSTTELPRLGAENYLSICRKLLSILKESPVPARSLRNAFLARKRVHGPADPDAEQQKQHQRPRNILYAIERAPPAQKTKRNGDQEREQQHRL